MKTPGCYCASPRPTAWPLHASSLFLRTHVDEYKNELTGTGHAFDRSGGSNNGRYGAARAVACKLGVDEAHDAVDAEETAAKVRELNARSGHVTMVGCSATDVLGLPGADAAEEAANVVLTAGNLEHVAFAIDHARRHGRVVAQSMVLSGVAVAMSLVGVAGSRFPSFVSVLGHKLSECAVIGSNLRLLRA